MNKQSSQSSRPSPLVCVAALVLACSPSSTPDTPLTTTTTESASAESASASSDEASASASSASASSADESDASASATTGPKLDILPATETGSASGGDAGDCGEGEGEPDPDLSYIWISNTGQQPATVSKINTESMLEEGRYMTRPDGGGDPSRTSVNLNGNMAVANREGGITKIIADSSQCPDTNPLPGLQTSTGASNILPFAEDECIAWHTSMQCDSSRPIAWTRGTWSEEACRYVDPKLWVSCQSNTTEDVLLLNGDTGEVEQTVPMPAGVVKLYGGAVDSEGNFWTLRREAVLVRVAFADFAVSSWPLPTSPYGPMGYGITVDSGGYPWVCDFGQAARFDPGDSTWQLTSGSFDPAGGGGCMADGQGTLYHPRGPGGLIVAVDTATVTETATFPVPNYVHGISIDFQGRVWGVTLSSTDAYRLDTTTGVAETVTGLVGAYTYSDMTGFALSSAGSIPVG